MYENVPFLIICLTFKLGADVCQFFVNPFHFLLSAFTWERESIENVMYATLNKCRDNTVQCSPSIRSPSPKATYWRSKVPFSIYFCIYISIFHWSKYQCEHSLKYQFKSALLIKIHARHAGYQKYKLFFHKVITYQNL